MRLREIPLSDVAAGRRWRLVEDQDGRFQPLEEARCEPAVSFDEDDIVVYSAIAVAGADRVTPLLMVKRVGDYDYGGDTAGFVGVIVRRRGSQRTSLETSGRGVFPRPVSQAQSGHQEVGKLLLYSLIVGGGAGLRPRH